MPLFPKSSLGSQGNPVREPLSLGIGEMHFVVSSGLEKPDVQLRKLIRSHVMLGKNKGKTLPPRKRKGTAKETQPTTQPPVAAACDASLSTNESIPSGLDAVVSNLMVVMSPHPRVFGSRMGTITLADGVDVAAVDVIIKFSSIAKQILFQNLEPLILFNRRAETWIEPLTYDAVFLHTMIFTSSFFFTHTWPRKISKDGPLKTLRMDQRSSPAFPSLVKALNLLRKRFDGDDEESKISIGTVAAVMSLVGHAHTIGDERATRFHLDGLEKIVRMRGGMSTFDGAEKLLLEVLRNDVGISLSNGWVPTFFRESACREPFTPYPDLTSLLELCPPVTLGVLNTTAVLIHSMDTQLAQAWTSMSEISRVINFAADSKQRITTKMFFEAMSSIMYRLLDMNFQPHSHDEILRLGLLAFSTSIFLPWRNIGMDYPHLCAQLREVFADTRSKEVDGRLMLWILMGMAVSVFDIENEPWLVAQIGESLRNCGITSWNKMRGVMSNYIWVGCVYDKPGMKVFDSVMVNGEANVV